MEPTKKTKEGNGSPPDPAPGSFVAGLARRFPTSWQFVLFCLVGGSGLVVDYAVLVPLTEFAGWDPRAAAVVGAFRAAR